MSYLGVDGTWHRSQAFQDALKAETVEAKTGWPASLKISTCSGVFGKDCPTPTSGSSRHTSATNSPVLSKCKTTPGWCSPTKRPPPPPRSGGMRETWATMFEADLVQLSSVSRFRGGGGGYAQSLHPSGKLDTRGDLQSQRQRGGGGNRFLITFNDETALLMPYLLPLRAAD